MAMQKTILQTSKLSIGYRSHAVASAVEINLKTSQLTALVGINGAGKSTLLRTISGLQPKLSGEILIDGCNVETISRRGIAKKLSIVLTEKLPESNLTVFELVATARQPYTNWIGTMSDDDTEIINTALKLTQTLELSQKKVGEISDGQLQKVMVARALAQDTPVIILDEPTTHLDIQHKISLLKLLRTLAHDHQKCILFSTHDIELAIQVSDTMIVMNSQTSEQDTPQNLLSRETFSHLFNDDEIAFDSQQVKFLFKGL